ncbi:WD40/YVTN/BNR-like repeat-containing protein [Acidicapsa dinghuensis]|uniref:WD40/YVTN/BNR-like repeat-containing protein n=1 Tax=Acidicapsa dinghuensis TaxID=2218256 RepID=A0ABW1EK63_9BACT|nr:transcriptional regulator [Acidicapsa dinghuensis]
MFFFKSRWPASPGLNRGLIAVACVSAMTAGALIARAEAPWRSIGPFGGDVRSFTAVPGEPGHVYLGDADSWVFESTDDGLTWKRLSRVDGPDGDGGLLVDDIVVDASDTRTLYAGVHRVDRVDGGVYVSHDAGETWKAIPALKGQSIRSLAQAPSDPNVLVAGSLEGVYRSTDHGTTWELISPAGSHEIHEVESLAIDPRNPGIIYAGTWHLPWKTSDDGKHWRNIKKGVIDDSDVFSIIIDPRHPSVVYASACSGIYKSEDAGDLFHKVQGIPSTARRTRVLMQDPNHREIVYAGTTEGLYRTRDSGHEWQRLTGDDVVVNDIYLDPAKPGRILLATDRGGVLASDNGGSTFAESNQGFSARKVEALVADNRGTGRILAGIVNDKAYGGVFETVDGGGSWNQIANGLDGRDVFTLAQSNDGTVLAGTSHGIFMLEEGAGGAPRWTMTSSIVNTGSKVVSENIGGHKVNRLETVTLPAREMGSRVMAFDLSGNVWLAATAEGLFTSADKGMTWQGGLVMGSSDYITVAVWDGEMLAARRQGVVYSRDHGQTWDPMGIPSRIKDIHTIAFSKDGSFWIGAGDGIYFSRDKGKTWFWLEKVPARDVGDLAFDMRSGKMLATSRISEYLYSIDPATLLYTRLPTGYRLFMARTAGGVAFAASLQNGVLMQPKSEKPEVPKASLAKEQNPALKQNAQHSGDSRVKPALSEP